MDIFWILLVMFALLAVGVFSIVLSLDAWPITDFDQKHLQGDDK